MCKDSLVVRNNGHRSLKEIIIRCQIRLFEKLLNIHVYMYQEGQLKRSTAFRSNGFSQWYKICEFKVSCVINVF